MRGVDAKFSGEKSASKHRAFVRKRTTWLFLVYALLFAAIAGRLFYVQVVKSKELVAQAAQFRDRKFTTPAARGTIYDRNGRVLAVNIKSVSVFAHPREIRNLAATSVKLAHLLCTDVSSVEKKLSSSKSRVWLARQVDARIGEAIKKDRENLPGVDYQVDTKRVYPAGPLAAQIIGFTDIDSKGVEGIEKSFDLELTGKDGAYRAEIDRQGRAIPQTRRDTRTCENGKDVYLTIDATIQYIAEQALAATAKKFAPESASAIVIDPDTGEILALANYPTYDPNKARSVKSSLWRNRAAADLYEPGSTLKVVTIAGGLNEGLPARTPYAYCTGRERMKGGSIPCVLHKPYLNGHGAADMYRIIEQSCNIGAAHVGLKLGYEKLRHYEKAFGLMEKCRAGLGCEAGMLPMGEDEWKPIRVADIGFGQGIAVTALQMASVYATLANGGERMKLQVIRELRRTEEDAVTVLEPFAPVTLGNPVSKGAADELNKMLMNCVENGTGKPAQIDGRTVAGKTGSAQIALPGGKGYESGAFVASFMGYAPAMHPRLAIAVVVTRPKNSHWGASVAAPVFKEIGEKALWYLKVPSDAPMKKDIKSKPVVDKKKVA